MRALARLLFVIGLGLAAGSAAVAFPYGGGTVVTTPPPPPPDQMAACLATMPSNSWKDASTCPGIGVHTTLRSVAWNCTAQPCSANGQPGTPSDAPTTASLVGGSDVSGVMEDFAGAVWDPDDKLLISWGGGHLGYYGNELYGFNFATLQWQRLSVPSSVTGFTKGANAFVMPDGNPIAPHTYNGLQYVSGIGLFQLGTAGNDSGNTSGQSWKQTVSGLSPTAYNHWIPITDVPNLFLGQTSGVDSTNNRLYVWGGFESIPIQFVGSPYTGAWSSTGGSAINNGTAHTSAVQPGVQFIAVGSNASTTGNFLVAALPSGNETRRTFTGDASVPNCTSNPGFVWDQTGGQFVGWCGGKGISVLNPSTYNFVALAPTGATPTCTSANSPGCTGVNGVLAEGTFGRFQCLRPVYSGCAVVNDVDDHVFIYRF